MRYPIVRMLYEYGHFTQQSTSMVAYALLFHALGLSGTGGTRVIVQMFFAMKDTRTPVYVAGVCMAVNLALCYYLSGPLKLGGIALAGSISAFLNFFLLYIILKMRVGMIIDRATVISFVKSLIASMVMSAVLYLFLKYFTDLMLKAKLYNAGLTLIFLFLGVLLFFVVNVLLKNKDIVVVKDALIKRVKE